MVPDHYGTKQLFLMAQEPHRLLAQWDFSPEAHRVSAIPVPAGPSVLRIYKDSLAGSPVQEIPVSAGARDWFVNVPEAGTAFVAELGCFNADRTWTQFAVSGPASTPPKEPAPLTDLRFATVPVDIPLRDLRVEAGPSVRIDPALDSKPVRPSAPETVLLPRPVPALLPEAVLAHARARAEDAHKVASSSETAASPTEQRQAEGPAGSASMVPQSQEAAIAEVLCHATEVRQWVGSQEITELLRGARKAGAGESSPAPDLGQAARLEAAEAGLVSGPAFWSGALPQSAPPAAREFWLNVNVELVIYGSTESDATLMVGGRKIEVGPDGRFSLRFALPDGIFELPVSAVSADGERGRRAEFGFSRVTAYRGEVGIEPQDPQLAVPQVEAAP